MLDLRVRRMISLKRAGKILGLRDIITPRVAKNEDSIEYMLKRTMLRPRDIITFFNMCMIAATGKEIITTDDIYKAELRFSESRMTALRDEWKVDYPNILILISILRKMPASFKIIENGIIDRLSVLITETLTHRDATAKDHSFKILTDLYNIGDYKQMVIKTLEILYKFGVVGIKNEHFRGIEWAFKQEKYPLSEIHDESFYIIHPSVWSILGITPIDLKRL